MSFEHFNNFLKGRAGVVPKVGFRNTQSFKSVFFKPYVSMSDIFFRAAAVVTAPINISILSLEFAILSIAAAIESLSYLATLNPGEAWKDLKVSGDLLTVSAILLLSAIISPFIYTVDLIGSAVTTFSQNTKIDEQGNAYCNA